MTTTTRLAITDLETTSLDPATGRIWEGCILQADLAGDGPGKWTLSIACTHTWMVDDLPGLDGTSCPDVLHDPHSLRVGGFHERHPAGNGGSRFPPPPGLQNEAGTSAKAARLLHGRVLTGINPWFDAAFLEASLKRIGKVPSWSHRLLDVRALVLGMAAHGDKPEWLSAPPSLSEMLEHLSGKEIKHEAHTATGDALMTAEVLALALDARLVRADLE